MKLLFNLDVVEGNKLEARPGDYLKALPAKQQITEVEAFLQWAEDAAKNDPNPQARAEAEIGVVTTKEFLDAMQNAAARIYTGD